MWVEIKGMIANNHHVDSPVTRSNYYGSHLGAIRHH